MMMVEILMGWSVEGRRRSDGDGAYMVMMMMMW